MFRTRSACRIIEFNFGEITHPDVRQTALLSGHLLYPPTHLISAELAEISREHLQKAHELSIQWTLDMGLVSHDSMNCIKALEAAKFAFLFTSALNQGSIHDLKIMADFCIFLFLLDDIVDSHFHVIDKYEFSGSLTTLGNIFKGLYQSEEDIVINLSTFPRFKGFCKAAFDILKRLQVTGMNLNHFSASIEQTLTTTIWATLGGFRNRQDTIPLSKQTYIEARQKTGAVDTVFELTYILNRMTLSEELRSNTVFKRLTLCANNIICVFNDLVSLKKEIAAGDKENLTQVCLFEMVDFDRIDTLFIDAIQTTIAFHNHEVCKFLKNQSFLPHEYAEILEVLRKCINDNFRWSLQTIRYGMSSITYQESLSTLEEFQTSFSNNANLSADNRGKPVKRLGA